MKGPSTRMNPEPEPPAVQLGQEEAVVAGAVEEVVVVAAAEEEVVSLPAPQKSQAWTGPQVAL